MSKKAKVLQNFLEKSCGFSKTGVKKLYKDLESETPRRMALGSRRDRNVVANLRRAAEAGLNPREIKGRFTRLVNGLATSPHEFQEKWRWYVSEFKLTDVEMKAMVLDCPYFLQYNLDTTVLPLTDAFYDLGVSLPEFRSVIKKAPRLLTCSKEGVHAYQELGLFKNEILNVCRKTPELITVDYARNFEKKLQWFKDVVGVDGRAIVSKWLAKHPRVFYGNSQRKWQERYDFLTYAGFSKDDVARMIKEYPQLLSKSIGDLQDKISVVKSVMGRDMSDIVRHPVYLTRSFDMRISVRLAYMAYKGESSGQYSLRTLFLPNDKNFSEKYAKGSQQEFWKFVDWWVVLDREVMNAFFKLERADQVALVEGALRMEDNGVKTAREP
ncbi:hypothetical protein BSKO_11503 [Bryopsis sp. KO-2023]|nr:hypothetical protein BSKO_11503 [Bryopsis sp. KO-2023]